MVFTLIAAALLASEGKIFSSTSSALVSADAQAYINNFWAALVSQLHVFIWLTTTIGMFVCGVHLTQGFNRSQALKFLCFEPKKSK